MKHRFSLLYIVFVCCSFSIAQEHIQVVNPHTWDPEALRPYINQVVTFDAPMVVCNNYNGLTISTRRLFTPTNQEPPYMPQTSSPLYIANSSAGLTLTGVNGYHRCGEKIYNLTARVTSTSSLSWISGEWRGNTRTDMENMNVRQLVNIDGCDECLLVCTMNLEYYLVANTGSGSMGPSSYSAHQKQRAKTSKALAKINADLYGLVEIEQGQQAPAEIANDLKTNTGRNFTYINDNSSPSGTYTKSAFVYDKDKLKPIGVLQEIETGVKNRKKMICFEEIATGERFIFSVNHFKAKSSGGSGRDADQNDGQGGYNNARVQEAQAVVDKYKSYRQNGAIREDDILIMGDLNAYAKEDPITLFINNEMLDLHREFHADSSYSYTYHGMAGYLDQAICSGSLRPQVMGACGFHINSDESDAYTYDKSNDETMFRSSDHDPVLVGLKLDHSLTYDPTPGLGLEPTETGGMEMTITNAFRTGQNSYYAIYDIYGRQVTSASRYKIEEAKQPIEKPSAPGVYILHIYFNQKVYSYKFAIQ